MFICSKNYDLENVFLTAKVLMILGKLHNALVRLARMFDIFIPDIWTSESAQQHATAIDSSLHFRVPNNREGGGNNREGRNIFGKLIKGGWNIMGGDGWG